MLEYALRLGSGHITVPDDDRDGTLERLAKYREWAPETVMVERHKPTPWVESTSHADGSPDRG